MNNNPSLRLIIMFRALLLYEQVIDMTYPLSNSTSLGQVRWTKSKVSRNES